MDFVNRLYGQLADVVRGMTPRTRLAVAALLVLVLGSLTYLSQREFSADTTYLLGGQVFSVSEITAMQGALGKAKLNDFVVEGNQIRIPRNRQAVYLAALADGNALPQTHSDILAEATDKNNWFASRHQQVEQAHMAKKKGLALILRTMSGVDSAEVDFEKEESRGLKRERTSTALIAVKLQGGQALSEDRAACFQRMAAAALVMAPQDVTVVDKTNHLVFGGRGAGHSGGPGDEVYRNMKIKYQADYVETVRKALAYVPGITVSADVELERELRHEEKRIEFDANSSVAVKHLKETSSVTNEGYDLQGRPLIATQGSANQPANIGGSTLPKPKSTTETSTVSEDVAPSQNQTMTELAGLTPKRVSISVGVPTSHFENIWRQQHPNPPSEESYAPPTVELARIQSEEIARIRQHVAGLIPTAEGASDTHPSVTVTPFSHMSSPEAPEPSLSSLAFGWLTNSWATLATIGVAVGGLITLRSVVRMAAGGAAANNANRATHEERVEDSHPAPTARFRIELEKRLTSGRSLREEVADLVREDPAAAANILRSWMGNTN